MNNELKSQLEKLLREKKIYETIKSTKPYFRWELIENTEGFYLSIRDTYLISDYNENTSKTLLNIIRLSVLSLNNDKKKDVINKLLKILNNDRQWESDNFKRSIRKFLVKEWEAISSKNTTTVQVKGFHSKLNDEQIKHLYEKMQNNYFETSLENLIAFLKGGNLDGIFIKWIDKSITRHEPNKKTIFEFLFLLKEYNYLESNEFDTTSSNINNLYRKLETVFPDIKNFPQSNSYKVQKNTERQKELETIIQTL